MQITLFLEASTMEETKQIINNFKNFTNSYDVNLSVSKVEKYWKIENMYRTLLEVDILSKAKLKMMMNSIASIWKELPDEYLASKTMDDCKIYIPNLYMIIVNLAD
ncbi:hypothetical protein [Lysinibacillus sp. SGAir0095]|uniref:hypothetical protein n=1 Tax=Lysinibacillus sp. SGAir0095 TaxID=2070463 RepID=UPI0010CD4205|nr:hypothetical protein [Lysinibacillus sp. SGAir0095]QCR31963.1 hypothetical protein C1N55_07150 [Lysinibacillus sp. SGAir0095]